MKRIWQPCLAMIASATMLTGFADAQNNWNAPSEIGSYQSILSRAGYGDGSISATAPRMPMGSGSVNASQGNMQQGNVLQGNVPAGNMNGGFNGGMTNGSMNQGMAQPRTTQPRMGTMNQGMMGQGSTCTNCGPMGSATGGMNQGALMNGPVANGPVVNGPMVNNAMSNGPVVNGGVYNQSAMMVNSYSGVAGNTIGCSGPTYADPAYHPPIYGQPFSVGASPVANIGASVGQIFNGGGRAKRANWVAGLYAMSFARDYEDTRRLSRNPSGDYLNTTDADEGDFGGYGVSLQRRAATGKGLELRYWAFNPDAFAQLDGASVASVLPTLDQLWVDPALNLDAATLYGEGANHVVFRNTDINNFEVNLLNNGGNYCTRRGRQAQFELLGGFRWFQFDETLSYISNTDTATYPTSPSQITYQSSVENDLLGFQLGARNEICLTGRLRGFLGLTTGLFNNRINARQRFFDSNGDVPTLRSGPSAGRDFDYSDQKDQVAIIGELDAGVTYMVSQRLRARFGYRTFGAAGVALAADQIPYDFTATDQIQRANSNGSLLLHGGYMGLEACF